MSKFVAIFLLAAAFVFVVESATVDDYRRAANHYSTEIRLDAISLILQEQLNAMARHPKERACVVGNGTPALQEINDGMRKAQEEMGEEISKKSPTDIVPLSRRQVEKEVRDELQKKVDVVVQKRVNLMNGCSEPKPL